MSTQLSDRSADAFDQEREAAPTIGQIIPASGWWLAIPEIDEQTGAVMTTRIRVMAFALCTLGDGSTKVLPVAVDGTLGVCEQLTHEADAGLLSKYKKRVRAAAGESTSLDPAALLAAAAGVASRPVSNGGNGETSSRPDDLSLKHLKTAIGEALQWVSDILDKDPGDELLRQCRQQLRWMQGAVDNQRRPTASELANVTLSRSIIPQLIDDDAYLAQMLIEVESLYREL
jgi:hypothetical protein